MRKLMLAGLAMTVCVYLAACSGGGGGGGGSPGGSGGSNNAPVAADDAATTPANVFVDVNVLANDSDADGDLLSASILALPGNGNVSITGSMARYVPNSGFAGNDTFSYTLSDGRGGTDVASVSITVQAANNPPVANGDSASTLMNTPKDVNVLINDTDVDGDPLSAAVLAMPANGTVTFTGGVASYVPASGFVGSDNFSYTVSDGNGGSDSAVVSITVAFVNTPPVANDDIANVAPGMNVAIAVLANDTDINGQTLSVSFVGTPANGSAVLLPTGSIRYTPNAGYTGQDSFQYMCDDGAGGNDTGSVSVTVAMPAWSGGAPLAFNTNYGSQDVTLADLNNDGKRDAITADARSDSLTVHLNTSSGGTLTFATGVRYAVSLTHGVSAADFNNDGFLDLAATAPLDNVAILLNKPTAPGSFNAPIIMASGSGSLALPIKLKTGDMNGDSKPDFVATNMSDRSISVFINTTPASTFTPTFNQFDFNIGIPGTSMPWDLTLADFNGDNKLDVAISDNGTSTFSVMLNTTVSGNFNLGARFEFNGSTGYLYNITVADLNGDGRSDIVLAVADSGSGSNGGAYVCMNRTAVGGSTPAFDGPIRFAGTSGGYAGIACADLNGDGRADLIAGGMSAGSSPISVWLNQTTPGASNPSFMARQDVNIANGVLMAVAAGDLNGDNKVDVIAADDTSPGRFHVTLGQ